MKNFYRYPMLVHDALLYDFPIERLHDFTIERLRDFTI